ncbi:MAG: winged helix-turn-helix transcriptional regulator [Clostridiales bacterium]|nr:winged helix-turn-helix transcriptional regulator [Clostridiales bacterium]
MYLKNIVRELSKTSLMHRYIIHRTASANGLYLGQPPILEYLKENSACTQNRLAEHLHVSPASVAVSIKRMQKAGLVEKLADEGDLRCNRISITPTGEQLIDSFRDECEKVDEKLFSGFSEEEIKHFCSYLERLQHNISDLASPEEAFRYFACGSKRNPMEDDAK